jgi:diadenosine tetraphosphate (Ap4A) HIT family hydrolase
MPIISCDFCDEFSEGEENTFASIYKSDPKSRVLCGTPNFAVVPSLGQIVEGYLLIVPIKHYTAMADLPAELLGELSSLCLRVRNALSEVYGPALFFEHGIRGNQSGGCGIDHAHMHAVPFTGVSEPIEELKKSHSLKLISGILEIDQQVAPNSPYVYYEQTNEQAWACEIDFIPSQYLRKILAESLGINSWDWRECGREQALITSLERLSQFFNGDVEPLNEVHLSPFAKTARSGTSN